MPQLLQPYSEDWSLAFAQIASVLRQTVGLESLLIHHVGSTAVPDMVAKPIIDIDVVLPVGMTLTEMAARLTAIGYTHHGDQGIAQREVFKRRNRTADHPVLDTLAHHLYVCPPDSQELSRHLKFRDALREQAWAHKAYATLKISLAAEVGQDHKLYAKLKERRARDLVERILAV